MKLLYVYDLDSPKGEDNRFYSKTFSYEMWKNYLEVFDEVSVVSKENEQTPEEIKSLSPLTGAGVTVLPVPGYVSNSYVIRHFWRFQAFLLKEIKSHDAVIIRMPSVMGSFASILCNMIRKPYLVEVVGDSFRCLYYHGSFSKRLMAPVMEVLTKYSIQQANTVNYITKWTLQKKYPNKHQSFVVPNVRLTANDDSILQERLVQIENRQQGGKVKIGLIGSLNVAYKGHATAIKALELLTAKGVDCELEFIGEGDLERFRKGIPPTLTDRVRHLGILKHQDVQKWLKELDIYIQPSFTEAQGRSIIEAMNSGCPVVASRVGGIVELLEEEMLFTKGDHKQLADRILKLIADKEGMLKQSERNYKESLQYTYDKVYSDRIHAFRSYEGNLRKVVRPKAVL